MARPAPAQLPAAGYATVAPSANSPPDYKSRAYIVSQNDCHSKAHPNSANAALNSVLDCAARDCGAGTTRALKVGCCFDSRDCTRERDLCALSIYLFALRNFYLGLQHFGFLGKYNYDCRSIDNFYPINIIVHFLLTPTRQQTDQHPIKG